MDGEGLWLIGRLSLESDAIVMCGHGGRFGRRYPVERAVVTTRICLIPSVFATATAACRCYRFVGPIAMLRRIHAVGLPPAGLFEIRLGLHPRRSLPITPRSIRPGGSAVSVLARKPAIAMAPVWWVSTIVLRVVIAIPGRRSWVEMRSGAASIVVVLGIPITVSGDREQTLGAARSIVAVSISIDAASPVPICFGLRAVQGWPPVGPIDGGFEATNCVQRSLPSAPSGIGFIGFSCENVRC